MLALCTSCVHVVYMRLLPFHECASCSCMVHVSGLLCVASDCGVLIRESVCTGSVEGHPSLSLAQERAYHFSQANALPELDLTSVLTEKGECCNRSSRHISCAAADWFWLSFSVLHPSISRTCIHGRTQYGRTRCT